MVCMYSGQPCDYSLHDINFFHERVTHVAAVQVVGQPVEAAPERIAETGGTNLGQTWGGAGGQLDCQPGSHRK